MVDGRKFIVENSFWTRRVFFNGRFERSQAKAVCCAYHGAEILWTLKSAILNWPSGWHEAKYIHNTHALLQVSRLNFPYRWTQSVRKYFHVWDLLSFMVTRHVDCVAHVPTRQFSLPSPFRIHLSTWMNALVWVERSYAHDDCHIFDHIRLILTNWFGRELPDWVVAKSQ